VGRREWGARAGDPCEGGTQDGVGAEAVGGGASGGEGGEDSGQHQAPQAPQQGQAGEGQGRGEGGGGGDRRHGRDQA